MYLFIYTISVLLVVLTDKTKSVKPLDLSEINNKFEDDKKNNSFVDQIKQRENSSDKLIATILPCEEYADCNSQKKYCSCDPSCELFNDCCNFNFQRVAYTDRQRYIVSAHRKCIKVINKPVWLIDQCPENISIATAYDNRTRFPDKLPVTDRFNISYKNARIAECHGISDYIPWRMSISDITQQCQLRTMGFIRAESIIHMLSNKSLTPFSLVNILFDYSCSTNLYPPKGMSIHLCSGYRGKNFLSSENCSSIYRPVYGYDYTNTMIIKSYQNLDCCKKFNGCTRDYRCIISTADHLNPFDDTRGNLMRKTSMILLDLNKKSHDKHITLQYLNIKYEREFTFLTVSHRLDKEDLMSMYCLLKIYLESNGFAIDRLSLRFYEAQTNSNFLRYMASVLLLLNLNHPLRDIGSVRQVERWLDSMQIKIEEHKAEPSDDVIIIETGNVLPENISVIHNFFSNKKTIHLFNYDIVRISSLCRFLNKKNTSPPRWCQYLYVKATAGNNTFNVHWTCKPWVDKIMEKKQRNDVMTSMNPTHEYTVVTFCASYIAYLLGNCLKTPLNFYD